MTEICVPHVYCSSIHRNEGINQSNCPSTDDWSKKIWFIHSGMFLSHKKEGNLAVSNKMGGTRNHHTQWNQPVSKRHIVCFLLYVTQKLQEWHGHFGICHFQPEFLLLWKCDLPTFFLFNITTSVELSLSTQKIKITYKN